MELLSSMGITEISYGILFVWLLVDSKKENKIREEKYQETINKLADKFNILENIQDDVTEIKQEMRVKNE